jgi:tRNA U34 5-carboxymethylaminomethyl modifying GTPase MnmE/TrmE
MADEEPTAPNPSLQRARQALEVMVGAATAYQRGDLVQRLQVAQRRMNEPEVRVLVVGEYKKGKSSLINQLLNAPVCPVDDDVATAVPTVIRYGDPLTVAVVLDPRDGDTPAPQSIAMEELADYVTELGNPGNQRRVRLVEVSLPRKMLAGGLILVDTPGVGGLGSAHTASTIGALPTADAVVFVSDASQELTEPELQFLRTARDLCPNLLGVLTKIDFYPEWRRILELDVEHLKGSGLEHGLLPLSSALRQHALAGGDQDLNAESGYPQFVARLQEIVSNGEELTIRSAVHDILWVVAQLDAMLRAEQSALSDPERATGLAAELTAIKERADRLRSETARWQQTLNDGITDLTADLDHDLRTRTRTVVREAEEAIDQEESAEAWDEFEAWLYRRMTAEVVENYSMLAHRAEQLSERVAEHFGQAEADIVLDGAIEAPTADMEALSVAARPRAGTQGLASQGMVALRSAYGGVAMFGMLGGLAGLAFLNPFTLTVGLLMGRKAIKDHKEREMASRRQDAKNAVRKYVDEVNFQVGKDSKDTVRRVQRALRDTFQTRADELQRSTSEALLAAQRAVQTDQAGREKRLPVVNEQLRRLRALRDQVVALAPGLVSAGAPSGP